MARLLALVLLPFALAGPILPVSLTSYPVCTSTATITDHGFTGSFSPTTTVTLFASTATSTNLVDCGACAAYAETTVRAPFWGGHGPGIVSTTTVKVALPTTSVITECALPTGIIH